MALDSPCCITGLNQFSQVGPVGVQSCFRAAHNSQWDRAILLLF